MELDRQISSRRSATERFPDHARPLRDRKFRPIAEPLGVALGGTLAAYAKPAARHPDYGEGPVGRTVFSKLVPGL